MSSPMPRCPQGLGKIDPAAEVIGRSPSDLVVLPVPRLIERWRPGLSLGVIVPWVIGILDPDTAKLVRVGKGFTSLSCNSGTVAARDHGAVDGTKSVTATAGRGAAAAVV